MTATRISAMSELEWEPPRTAIGLSECFWYLGQPFAVWRTNDTHACSSYIPVAERTWRERAGANRLRASRDRELALYTNPAAIAGFKIDGDDGNDHKPDTTQTAGSERRYLDQYLYLAINGSEQTRSDALYILQTWNIQQLNRPWGWDGRYAPKHDEWLDAGGPGWCNELDMNRVDCAHASRSQHYALALLGCPLGLMNFWLELRVLVNDAIRQEQTGGSWCSQPREIGWTLIALQRAINLGIERVPIGDGAGGWEWRHTRALLAQAVADAANKIPERFPLDRNPNRDGRVFPQIPGTEEFNGYYCWQWGIVGWAMRYLQHHNGLEHINAHPQLASIAADVYLRSVKVGLVPGEGMAYSWGTTAFDTLIEINALRDQVDEKDRYKIIADEHPFFPKAMHVKKSIDWDYQMVHQPWLSHYAPEASVEFPARGSDYEPEYMAGLKS